MTATTNGTAARTTPTAPAAPGAARTLTEEHRRRLLRLAHDVSFPPGARICAEDGRADRFWVVRSGTVALDMRMPGRPPAVVATLGPGELVGWSWLFPPASWQPGAVALGPVRAHRFDGPAVRLLCRSDPDLGTAVGRWAGQVLARRLHAARSRLLDAYAPCGGGAAGR
ncbi:cyclic nucleotide-binding domain-containing protein [Streptomyces minutiscleroticus]|uniref:Cyclic nucleotide-binding domain-containing protein n=1 Tax=Streptomyces minutiscleroticus TaxID=68238 RepID=A0A918NKJ0_9ACTN|nr:cyclic nucleotide-binding domain-containing protein [Streptomyces minutiscleroticus]GGX75427.1 hypothetical protein GCM10010358_32100 [Streptomyces minutiscleroticus]